MSWIALYLPELPLQLAQRARQAEGPCVVAEGGSGRPQVCCASAVARERGILPGMSVAAARALAGELVVLRRDPAAETQALQNLACWAGQFTPGVVLQEGEGLLLEVASTLRLHGGLLRLLARLRQGLAELGYRAEPGVAPTPLAAWLLARAAQAGLPAGPCTNRALLPRCLERLPLALLDWPAEVLKALQALGVRDIGHCLRLPRDGFVRRFGPDCLRDLDRAVGRVPDPRPAFVPPASFASRLEFGFEVENVQTLLFPLKRLLQEMEGFLRGRGAGVQHWQLLLEHRQRERTRLSLGVVAPERSAERFLALARERLGRTALEAPVLGLGIVAEHLLPFAEGSASLLPDPRSRVEGWGQLVDKLSARLGGDKVFRLQAVDDHRPERAWKKDAAAGPAESGGRSPAGPRGRGRQASAGPAPTGADDRGRPASVGPAPAGPGGRGGQSAAELAPTRSAAGGTGTQAPRPLWLLRAPRSLTLEDGQPSCQGRLRLLAGPERIEAGWWDGRAARRDYYVARNPQGETLWIYREHRRGQAWYLHGIFA